MQSSIASTKEQAQPLHQTLKYHLVAYLSQHFPLHLLNQ